MDIRKFVQSVRTIAHDRSAVIAVIAKNKPTKGFFYECARNIRKDLKGIEKGSPLTEEDIDFAIQ